MDDSLVIRFEVLDSERDLSVDRLDMVGVKIDEDWRGETDYLVITTRLALGGVHSNSTVQYIARYLYWRYLKDREGRTEVEIGRATFTIENEEELVLAMERELSKR